jgi:DNA replication licensing factor MCM5
MLDLYHALIFGLLTFANRLPVGYTSSLANLRREFVERKGYSEQSLNRALQVLVRRESVQFRRGGALVYRSGV